MDDDLKPVTDPNAPRLLSDEGTAPPPPQQGDASGQTDTKKAVATMSVDTAKQHLSASASTLSQQAGDKALMFAEQGKDRAVDALEQLSKMIDDAADQVDEKLGGNGHYVRTAAGTVQGFADQLRDRKVDDLVDDARSLVRKSPGVAIGAAAAVGFLIARLASAGLDQRA